MPQNHLIKLIDTNNMLNKFLKTKANLTHIMTLLLIIYPKLQKAKVFSPT